MSKFPEWYRQEAIELYKHGLSYKNIADKLNVSIGYVASVIQKEGIARTRAGTKGMLIKHDIFDVIDTEEKAYLLGFMVADGFIRDRKEHEGGNLQKLVGLEIHRDDSYILERFSKLINCNNKLTEHKNCLVFRFHSDRVAEALSRFGIVERKTGHERVDWLGDIRQDLQRHVLRGLIDGDGWVGTTIKANKLLPNIGLTSSYECCLFVAKWFSDKLGIRLVSPASHIGCFVITYDGKSSCSKIAEYLYKDSTICLDRKYNKAIEIISRWS